MLIFLVIGTFAELIGLVEIATPGVSTPKTKFEWVNE
jgi:hypothetical protein